MKLNLLIQPVAEVHIGSSIIYLFPVRISDVNEFADLYDEADSMEKFRKFLPHIASLSVPKSFQEKRIPLPEELIEQLSAGDLEALASAYAGNPSLDKARAGNADEKVAPVTRHADEVAISYLDRLLGAEVERHRRIFAKINADIISPASDE
jgi:hypothetical protein